MNHKYISSESFDIIDNVFEVDEDISQTICILNKKGYYTKACCSGHVRNPRLYEIYNKKSNVQYQDSHLGYIINKNEDSYDILMPYTFTAVYIMFSNNYHFENLPNGFYKADDNTIEMIIDYYSNGQRKKCNDIDKEIKEANKLLLEWATSLCIKTK